MWSKLEAPFFGVAIGVMAFLMINVAMGRDIFPSPRRTHVPITAPELDLDPESLYSTNCAACHQANGQGLPGQFPPLAGSSWVTQDPQTPIRVVLLGISGDIEVNGQRFNNTMPSQAQLNDEQIALLMTKIRSSWGNEAAEVDAATVAAVRADLSGRNTPWNGGAELAQARRQ